MPRIFLIVSYPKSGNTWMRALLHSLRSGGEPVDINAIGAGVLPRTEFDWLFSVESSSLTPAEIAELRPPFVREWANRRSQDTVLLKAHEANLPWPGTTVLPYPPDAVAGVVHIVRDPRDVTISYSGQLDRSIDKAIDVLANPAWMVAGQRNTVSNQLPQLISSWSAHTASWLNAPGFNVRSVRYEDLLADTRAGLREIADFLGLVTSPDAIGRAVESASFANLQRQETVDGFRERPEWMPQFFRRGRAGEWRHTLTPEQVERIERDHREVMLRLGYFPNCNPSET